MSDGSDAVQSMPELIVCVTFLWCSSAALKLSPIEFEIGKLEKGLVRFGSSDASDGGSECITPEAAVKVVFERLLAACEAETEAKFRAMIAEDDGMRGIARAWYDQLEDVIRGWFHERLAAREYVRELLNAKGNPDTEEDDEGKDTMVGIAAEEEYLERMDAAKWHVSFWDYILEPLEGEIFSSFHEMSARARVLTLQAVCRFVFEHCSFVREEVRRLHERFARRGAT